MERDAGGAPHAVCRRRGKNEDQRRAPRAHVLLPERRLASTHAEGCRLCSPEEGTERAEGTGKAENQNVRRRRRGRAWRGVRVLSPAPPLAPSQGPRGGFPATPTASAMGAAPAVHRPAPATVASGPAAASCRGRAQASPHSTQTAADALSSALTPSPGPASPRLGPQPPGGSRSCAPHGVSSTGHQRRP